VLAWRGYWLVKCWFLFAERQNTTFYV